jgi:hypothetical protein
MVAVINTFRDVLDGRTPSGKGLQALAATIRTSNNFPRARATAVRVLHDGSTA